MAACPPMTRELGAGLGRPAPAAGAGGRHCRCGWVIDLARLEMLRQDADVEAQRQQERLEHQADLAVQSLERLLAGTEERLADWVSRPQTQCRIRWMAVWSSRSPQRASAQSFVAAAVYPSLPRRREPLPQLFEEGEIAEFRPHDHRRAAQYFHQLAQSPDRAVRAAP